jgi:hypothetical protein
MKLKREVRVKTRIKVKVRGSDGRGNSFEQTAYTVDVSRTGARLEGLGYVQGLQTLELSRGFFNRARFRVVWTGMPGAQTTNEIGVQQLDSNEKFWGIAFPPAELVNVEQLPANAATQATLPEEGPIPISFSAPTVAPTGPTSPIPGQPADVVPLAFDLRMGGTWTDRELPVTVRWSPKPTEAPQERLAKLRVVNPQSCLLTMRTPLVQGTEVELLNNTRDSIRRGKVTWCTAANQDGSMQVGVDMNFADPDFWRSLL